MTTERIKAGSYSRLSDFEKCKYRAFLKYVQKVPEPERPLPPGKTEHANDRGTRVHKAGELYIQGGVELVPELEPLRGEYERLRQLYGEGKVSVEGEWGFDRDWSPVAWFSENVFVRMKLDVMVARSETEATVVDLKTGKRRGNEVKHTDQGIQYQLGTFLRYPKLQTIDVEFWYPDVDDLHRVTYSRKQGMQHYQRTNDRYVRMMDCTEFPPQPSIFTCKWCPYRGNACLHGVGA